MASKFSKQQMQLFKRLQIWVYSSLPWAHLASPWKWAISKCGKYPRWTFRSAPQPTREDAIFIAREVISNQPVYLDTETTGLHSEDEIIEIAIIDHEGILKLESSSIRPSRSRSLQFGFMEYPIPGSGKFYLEWNMATSKGSIKKNHKVCTYNSEFDKRMMQQTHRKFKMTWDQEPIFFDIMGLFSIFNQAWDPIHRSYRLIRLENAGRMMGIPLSEFSSFFGWCPSGKSCPSLDRRIAVLIVAVMTQIPFSENQKTILTYAGSSKVFLHGPAGCGKTTLALSWLEACIKSKIPADKFWSSSRKEPLQHLLSRHPSWRFSLRGFSHHSDLWRIGFMTNDLTFLADHLQSCRIHGIQRNQPIF